MRIDADCRTFLRTVARVTGDAEIFDAFEHCDTVKDAISAFEKHTLVRGVEDYTPSEDNGAIEAIMRGLLTIAPVFKSPTLAGMFDYQRERAFVTVFAETFASSIARSANDVFSAEELAEYDSLSIPDQQWTYGAAIFKSLDTVAGFLDLQATTSVGTIFVLAAEGLITPDESFDAKTSPFNGGTTVLQQMVLSSTTGLDRDEVEKLTDDEFIDYLKERKAQR